MSNQKITELSSLSQNNLDPVNDLLLAVDVSNTSMSSGGTNVKITPKALVGPSLSDLIQTWNNGGTIFSGLKLNVTDTASDANSSLLDFQIGSSSRFKITKGGMGFLNNGGVGKGGLTFQDSIESIGVIEFFNSGDNTNSRGLVIRPLVSYTGERAAADGWVSMRFGGWNNQIWFGHNGSASLIQSGFSGKLFLRANGSTTPAPTSTSHISMLNNGNVGIGTDAPTTRLDIAGNVDVKNSTTATSLTLHQGYTDASNYRRFFVNWSTTKLQFGTQIAGTYGGANAEFVLNGTAFLEFNSGGKFFLKYRDITFGTWNGGEINLRQAAAFNGRLDVVDALVNATYRDVALGKLYVGGITSSFPMLDNSGTTLRVRLADGSGDAPITTGTINGSTFTSNTLRFNVTATPGLSADQNGLYFTIFGGNYARILYGMLNLVRVGNNGIAGIGSCSSVAAVGSPDCQLVTPAAHTWEMYGGANGQTFRVYNARTDDSNYDRGFMRWNSNVFEIGTERAGTYTTTRAVSISSGSMIFTLNGQSNGWGVYYSSFPILSGGTGSASFAAGIPVTINNRMNFVEIATPATPAADRCTIYAKDNGAGKTQLVVLMPDGVETILATQT